MNIGMVPPPTPTTSARAGSGVSASPTNATFV